MPGAVHIDGEDADYHTNPTSVDIDEFLVDGNTLLASMIEGGGQAVRLQPVEGKGGLIFRHMSIPSTSTPHSSFKAK